MSRSSLLTPLTIFALAGPAAADEKFFETRIRPLLVEHCFGCHGPDKQKSELRLDSADAVHKGGLSGEPAVIPGDPARSRLVRAVRHAAGAEPMPPKKKLADRDVADLVRWVADGAVYPTINVPKAEARHWAFVPPTIPSVPAVGDTGWVKSPIDRFILAELEAKGLRPSPTADRRTLIRRVTFDLTGLPPTPHEVDAFVADTSPIAFAKVVERLLSSSAYGERWGRHWLDVARYADSNGLDENVAYGNAWRYRDYVVRAFNADKPYNRFITEQIAGDLLWKDEGGTMKDEVSLLFPSSFILHPSSLRQSFDPLIATGFLALGPKVLAEVDEKKMELDIVDEQLDTLGQSVMGITLGCARCHDHKFDPLTQADYYALAGVFVSTKTKENFTKIARWHENPVGTPADLAKKAEHDHAVECLNKAIKLLTARADAQVRATAGKDEKLPDKLETRYPDETRVELKKLRDELATLQKAAPDVPSAMGVAEAKTTDVALLRRGSHLTPGNIEPRHFPIVLAGQTQSPLPAAESGRRELAAWLTRPDHPLTARVMVNRIWRWHFGQGIVRSVDNFGRLGEKPTHPALLDWLARRFIEGGWSVKEMHRLIVLSATYQQSSGSQYSTVDPDNKLLGRFPRRRLEAEEIRDSLLAVSGLLDRTAGGPAITHVKNREFLFDHTSKDGTKYDSRRRSIYLPVVRNHLYDVFQLFDTTDAAVTNGDRSTTTVPTQALFYLNSELVADSAARISARLLECSSDSGRADRLSRLAYGRPATEREVQRELDAVAGFESDLQSRETDAATRRAKAWALVCQAVLGSNEFVYVE